MNLRGRTAIRPSARLGDVTAATIPLDTTGAVVREPETSGFAEWAHSTGHGGPAEVDVNRQELRHFLVVIWALSRQNKHPVAG